MMDKQKGDFIFECDGCSAVLETDQADFGVAIKMLKRNGWKARKTGDVWSHSCESCGAKSARGSLV
jgi:hypothetical protein